MNTGGVTVSAMRNTSSASFDMFARSAPNIMQERSEDAPKKSAAADIYTTMYKNYIATIKQLADLAPDNVETDELSLFMRDGGP